MFNEAQQNNLTVEEYAHYYGDNCHMLSDLFEAQDALIELETEIEDSEEKIDKKDDYIAALTYDMTRHAVDMRDLIEELISELKQVDALDLEIEARAEHTLSEVVNYDGYSDDIWRS